MLTPDTLGLEYETVTLQQEGEPDLVGWYLPSRTQPPKGTVVFLHGNAENISTHIGSVHWLPNTGFSVLLAEYRGYGASGGEPDIAGVHRDAQRFLAHAWKTYARQSPLILYGQSLGASIALHTAGTTEIPLALVIAESGFATYRSVARDALRPLSIFRYFFYPFSIFISDEYSPLSALDSIDAPVLFIHGKGDETVSYRQSRKLHQALPGSTLWLIPDRGHMGIFSSSENRKRLEEFLNAAVVQYQIPE